MNGFRFDKNWDIHPAEGECDIQETGVSFDKQLYQTLMNNKKYTCDKISDDKEYVLNDLTKEQLIMKYGWYFDSKFYRREVEPPFSLKDTQRINLDGPYNQMEGYGTMTEQLTLAFKQLGYKVRGSRAWTEQNDFTNVSPDVLTTLTGYIGGNTYGIRLGQPDSYHACPGNYKIIYTMWEFPLLPDRWYDGIRNVDLTIVPCGWNKILWNQVQPNNTVVIPLGFNPKHYYPLDRPNRKLTFLTDGSLLGENNLPEVFNDLFCKSDDVQLIVKMKGERRTEVKGNITYLYGRFTVAEMRDWYRSGDVFVYPTHAEGFGLFPLEAMATGLPVIATDNPAMKSFMWEDHSYPVKVKNVDWYHYCDMGDLATKMYYVYNYFEEAQRKGKRAATFVHKHFTWQNTIEKIIEVLS